MNAVKYDYDVMTIDDKRMMQRQGDVRIQNAQSYQQLNKIYFFLLVVERATVNGSSLESKRSEAGIRVGKGFLVLLFLFLLFQIGV